MPELRRAVRVANGLAYLSVLFVILGFWGKQALLRCNRPSLAVFVDAGAAIAFFVVLSCLLVWAVVVGRRYRLVKWRTDPSLDNARKRVGKDIAVSLLVMVIVIALSHVSGLLRSASPGRTALATLLCMCGYANFRFSRLLGAGLLSSVVFGLAFGIHGSALLFSSLETCGIGMNLLAHMSLVMLLPCWSFYTGRWLAFQERKQAELSSVSSSR